MLEGSLPYGATRLPAGLERLEDLAYNLRWAWEPETRQLFRGIDPELWARTVDNPVLTLLATSPLKLEQAAGNDDLVSAVDRAARDLDSYLGADGWFPRTHPELKDIRVAYFSMEVGLTESLPLYAGGLGVLAGDHLKAASALDVPLVGVGILWQSGYFRQMLNAEGWQLDRYPYNRAAELPVRIQRKTDGSPLIIPVPLPGRTVDTQIWRVEIGRVSLVLLDTNLWTNSPADRGITAELYGGDREMRLQQEIVLGIGGMRALDAMGLRPDVCHLNESHAAFVALERSRLLMQDTGLPFAVARQAASAGNVFTTHTPVPAGFDQFDAYLMDDFFAEYARDLGISMESLLALGRADPGEIHAPFGMAGLALRCSNSCNAVSQLHGEVSRTLFRPEFPRFPDEEIPVGYVTNGIHTHSWISTEMRRLLHQRLGKTILDEPGQQAWTGVQTIPDEELWAVHCSGRSRLVDFARKRVRQQIAQRGAKPHEIEAAGEMLDPEVLTIGFARRFAEYKRPTLILRDRERLKRLLLHPDRPVQFVIAGKAHPADRAGKLLIQEIVRFASELDVRNRVVFLEDYDMATTGAMVQGVDIWLNNPRRPMEASGTSGMKVIPNGGLNLSVLDGWWAEAYSPEVGWAIGNGEEYEDGAYGDSVEAEALYTLLEDEIVPLFYGRGETGLPHGWIAKMKASMAQLSYRFNTNRMVYEYTERHYIPAAKRARALAANGYALARSLSEWETRVRRAWGGVKIEKVERQQGDAGSDFIALVKLNGLGADDVVVQVYSQPAAGDDPPPNLFPLHPRLAPGDEGPDGVEYGGHVPHQFRPITDYSVRILPSHPEAAIPLDLPLIAWE